MRSLTVLVMVIVFALISCKKDEASLPQQTPQTTVAESGTVREMPAPEQAQSTTVAVPQTATAAPTAAPAATLIASTEGELSDVRIDVTQFKRDPGGTVTLRLVLVNNSSDRVLVRGHWLGDSSVSSDHGAVGAIHLIDAVNKKKYFVVRDADQTCVCSREVRDVEPGKKANLWAKFAAPPADVQQLTIVVPHFTPIDEVPLS